MIIIIIAVVGAILGAVIMLLIVLIRVRVRRQCKSIIKLLLTHIIHYITVMCRNSDIAIIFGHSYLVSLLFAVPIPIYTVIFMKLILGAHVRRGLR